ncbi:hypothetical protein AB4Y45_35140 [Paraburkholderia sp. EG287A]|uniref:hypothetical protein n=1 Tax=Paraburkholderia sp. EG287A TaxID=3237012 RepID=UPI0034D1B37F
MSKQISQLELAQLLTKLLTDPNSGELDESAKFAAFMTDLGQVVADHCGGEIRTEAHEQEGIWYLGVRGNDSLPEDGGVWKDFDPEGVLFESKVDPTWVIYSFTEHRHGQGKGFWSEEQKTWVEISNAKRYTEAQTESTEFPFTPGRDAEWGLFNKAIEGIISPD